MNTAPPLPEPMVGKLPPHGRPGTTLCDCFTADQMRERDAYWVERLKASEVDAARYRWLRNFAREDEWMEYWGIDPPEKLDAAIDSAMGSTTSGEAP